MTGHWYDRYVESSHALLTGTIGGVVATHMRGGITNWIAAAELIFFIFFVTGVYVFMDVYSKPLGNWMADRTKEGLPWTDDSENDRIEAEWSPNRAS